MYGNGIESIADYEKILSLSDMLFDLLEEYIGDCRGYQIWPGRHENFYFFVYKNMVWYVSVKKFLFTLWFV